MESRRETLRIIGAIGTTCAFPFAANDLYGQHQHGATRPAQAAREPYTPVFFNAGEYETVSRLADLIIPPTETAGAVGARVPEYIDSLVHRNAEHQPMMREGLAWLDTRSGGRRFVELAEQQQMALLTPVCEAADRGEFDTAGARFFHAFKSMTADGYYTSQAGLVEELGYKGNTVLAAFPGCTHAEHR